jgi:hypothetical protein
VERAGCARVRHDAHVLGGDHVAQLAAVGVIGAVLDGGKGSSAGGQGGRGGMTRSDPRTATSERQIRSEPAAPQGEQLNRWTPSLSTPWARTAAAAMNLRASIFVRLVKG